MNVKIQSVHFDADQKLVEFVNARMSKLERFVEDATGAEVIMKVEKDHEHGNKVVTAILNVTGNDLVAEARGRSFEEAVDQVAEALKHQIEKHRNKLERA
jgi:putative sigma-54 modulation protein